MADNIETTPVRALPYGALETITGDENLLILVPSPMDESLACGGLIAESCRRGRPPFVMVLGDGTASLTGATAADAARLAAVRERETRDAVRSLGLDNERLLMAGLYGCGIPGTGRVFEAIVRAVTLVMWRLDCNVICAPWPALEGAEDERATYRIASAVSGASGVGLLAYATNDGLAVHPDAATGWRLDIRPQLEAKREALHAHVSHRERAGLAQGGVEPVLSTLRDYEIFLCPGRRNHS